MDVQTLGAEHHLTQVYYMLYRCTANIINMNLIILSVVLITPAIAGDGHMRHTVYYHNQ